jgi:hypothetical protein
LSGYAATDFTGALVGVFLENSLPTSAPSALRFSVNNSSLGGIQTDFKVLAPLIGQVFFVGDGRTGAETGAFQAFVVPPTATKLYLGYVDSCYASGTSGPGCYNDNAGAVTAVFRLYPTGN